MERAQEMDEDIDSDVSNIIPLRDELQKCSDILAEEDTLSNEFFQSSSNIIHVDQLDISLPSCSKADNNLPSSSKTDVNVLSSSEIDINLPSSSKTDSFKISKDIPLIPNEQENELLGLGVSVYDQTEFENEVIGQVDKALKAQEEKKRKTDLQRELKTVAEDIRYAKQRLSHIDKALSMAPKDSTSLSSAAKRELAAIKKEQENKLKHLKKLEAKQKTLQAFVSGDAEEAESAVQNNFEGEEEMDEETLYHLKNVFSSKQKETEEERLIRTGQMTPFGTVMQNQSPAKPKPRTIIVPEEQLTDFDKFLLNEAEAHKNKKSLKPAHKHPKPSTSKCSDTNSTAEKPSNFPAFTDVKAVIRKKQKVKVKLGSKHANGYLKKVNLTRGLVKNYKSDSEVSDFEMEDYNDEESFDASDDEYRPDRDIDDDDDDDYEVQERKPKKMNLTSGRSKAKKIIDDGDQVSYVKRIKAFEKSELIKKHEKILESKDGVIDSDDEDFTEFEGDYKIPNSVWNKLYKYQQTGVRWLWELHQQNCGGIIGDEMGLGKTIQVIAFLIGLKYSKLLTVGDSFRGLGPVILVCPATVMHQWVKEFHTWWPPFRVAILHESGSFVGKKELLIRVINKNHGILITSYAGIVQHQECLLNYEWHYIVLDEGHKIRNPDAQATLTVKQFRTPHRIILSGSPVQNNLKELWSLFDFIFPGKLGTLPIFMQQFSVPIVQGGYANASKIQVQTAYKCATVLRDSIKPYLLRRMKSDVKMSINLPNKSEQVLFCQLTEEQANLYKAYINSKEVDSILNARLQVFVGLINLRKICNHPDIFDGGPKIFKDTDVSSLTEEEQYGYYKRSGKMIVVEALLRLWHKQGHRVLLFTQSRQMMEILEIFVKSKNYTYMKMDGTSSISSRQPAINKFNSNPNIFVFLLTTRVGGLGVNLTGADRVIIYDPDWNPSTDAQARERAWRIGQEKQVTIYRLLTAGTIEEKIYHRQIFKQFVTNRVLKDPRQRRFFKSNDLYELFTFNEVGPQGTETSAIFAGTGSEVKISKKSHKRAAKAVKESAVQIGKKGKGSVSFSPEKLEQMKQLARKLSLELSKKNSSSEKVVNPSTEQDTNQASKISVADNSSTEQATSQISCISVAERKSADEKCISKEEKCMSKEKGSKKGRKRKPPKIDGEKIDYVVKTDIYKPPRTEEEENAKQDDYVLSKLFKKSGVYTALKHDTIVEASDPDYMIVEGEAEKVAKQAIKALKESRRMCARASEGIPTWTGQHGGVKPRFGQKKKVLPFTEISQSDNSDTNSKSPIKTSSKKSTFDGGGIASGSAPSSSDLLSAISERKTVFGTDIASDDEEESTMRPTSTKPVTQHDELLVDIRNFIAFRAAVDGQATTKEIVEAFRNKLPIQQNAVFKSLLSKICDFCRSPDGDGIWHLKEEFR